VNVLAWLLARLLPGRGRHAGLSDEDTLVFPRVAVDPEDDPPHWMTRLDLPPNMHRPYVDRGEEDR
jgi:hypothetical protein